MTDTFTWNGQKLAYCTGEYNSARFNERAVEVPIGQHFVEDPSRVDEGRARVLEVGNVLSHYGPVSHRVIDLTETGPNVDSVDMFDETGSYDRILAISTVEHVDWDDSHDPNGGVMAIHYLRGLLRSGGRLLVTVPFGYNPPLDRALLDNTVEARDACTFVRKGDGWVQTPKLEARPYGKTTMWADSVYIGTFGPLR